MYLEQLTFSRFIAASSIVIFHYGQNVYPFNLSSVSFIFNQANIGVSYFFILSGFIMVIAYGTKDAVLPVEYYKNRVARIYPLVILSTIPFLATAFFLSGKTPVSDILLNLFTIQAWFPGKALSGNFPLWSITVEVFFYLCFPFLVNHVYKKYKLRILAVIAVFVWLLSLLILQFLLSYFSKDGYTSVETDLAYYFPLMHLNQFLVGNVAGILFLQRPETSKGKYDVLLIILTLLLLFLLRFNISVSYHNGFLAIIFAPLIFVQAANKGYISQLLKMRLFVILGEISFAIYMLQVPVFETVNEVQDRIPQLSEMNATVLFCLKFAVLVSVAAFCYFYIEKPLRKRIKSIQFRKLNNAL